MRNLYLCLLLVVSSVTISSAQFGITKPFPLLTPSANATITLEGDRNTIITFSWNKGTTPVATASTYKWMMDTIGADFVNPAVLLCSCNRIPTFDTVLTMTYGELADNASAVKPISIGQSVTLEWNVFLEANNSAPLYENRYANAPFKITIVRGVFDDDLKPFSLITPGPAANRNIGGDVTQKVNLIWQSTDCPVSCDAPAYYFLLDSVNGNFDFPIIYRQSTSLGSDTFLDLPFIEIAGIMDAAGIKPGQSMDFRWTVRAVNPGSSIYAASRVITFVRNRFDNEHRPFALLTPSGNAVIKLENDTAGTIDFKWGSTDLPGNSNVNYTIEFDTMGGNFLQLHPLTPADTFFNDTTYSVTYKQMREAADLIYGDNWSIIKLVWRVRADIGSPFFYSSNTQNFTLIRGYFTGMADELPFVLMHGVFPNPAIENATLVYELACTNEIEISISDISGRNIQSTTEKVNAGLNNFNVPLSALTPGIYFYTLRSSNGIVNGKFCVSR